VLLLKILIYMFAYSLFLPFINYTCKPQVAFVGFHQILLADIHCIYKSTKGGGRAGQEQCCCCFAIKVERKERTTSDFVVVVVAARAKCQRKAVKVRK